MSLSSEPVAASPEEVAPSLLEPKPSSAVFEKSADSFNMLSQQIKLARLWLPLVIVGIVLIQQLIIMPMGGENWRFWGQLLFYGIVGPAATFATLSWIRQEVRDHEQAQRKLGRLFDELQASHALLTTIQKVTEQFARANELESILAVASEGIAHVTRAQGVAIFMGHSDLGITHSYGLSSSMRSDALQRNQVQQADLEQLQCSSYQEAGQPYWVLSTSLFWGGRVEGSIHGYYSQEPSPEQYESFSIVSSEFSAAAEAARSRTRDLLTLFEVDRSIRAEGNLEHLLATLLTQMMSRADASIGGVYLADEDKLLQLRAWHGLEATPLSTSVRMGEGLVGQAAARRESCIVAEVSEELRSTSGPILYHAGSAISLPLFDEDGLLGVIILAHAQSHHFQDTVLPFLSLLAGQVSLAVRNARAYLQSEELAIAAERARIAREIHDGVAQSLAFSALKLDLVSRLLEQRPEQAKQELANVKTTIRETIQEVRRSIFALRPIDLEHHGFVETIRRYSQDYGQQNNVYINLDIQDSVPLSVKSEAVLFRIFQEAMNNVAKHAKARSVTVSIGRTESGEGFVSVEDDGCGFDPSSVSGRVSSAGGLGLKQMRERVEARGGKLEVRSHNGQGTSVFASLPE